MFRGFFLNHLPLNICSHLMGGRGASDIADAEAPEEKKQEEKREER